MLSIVVVVLILVMLFASTLIWAARYAAGKSPIDRSSRLIDRARLSATAVPLGLMLLLIAVSAVALVAGYGQGSERLFSALASRPARLALLLCAMATTVPVYYCGLIWYKGAASLGARLHLFAHVGLLCALMGVLLALSFNAG